MGKALNHLLLLVVGIAGGIGYLFYLCEDQRCESMKGTFISSAPMAYEDGSIMSSSSFLAQLSEQGTIQDTWGMDDPPMGVRGTTAIVGGEFVLFFEYASEKEAKEEARSLAKESKTAQGVTMHWGENAHYFQKRSLIAVYIGQTKKVIGALQEAFGNEVL